MSLGIGYFRIINRQSLCVLYEVQECSVDRVVKANAQFNPFRVIEPT